MLGSTSGAVVLEREETERGEVVLRRRPGADGETIYEIISNGVFLMASTNGPSARQLAHLGLAPLQGRAALRVLVGGLGMGYTLQAVLEHANVTQVDVVEIEPLIVQWGRGHLGSLNGAALDDARTNVIVQDLAAFVDSAAGPYDAILLDIDNGPEWLVLEENAAVYGRSSLQRMRALLSPGGVLGVWAAERSPAFLAELEGVFGSADEIVVVESAEGKEIEYLIYRTSTPEAA